MANNSAAIGLLGSVYCCVNVSLIPKYIHQYTIDLVVFALKIHLCAYKYKWLLLLFILKI